jgi:hypothetical protein
MTFQFNIEILEIDSPKVWRSVVVPGSFTFHDFHHVIQGLFGWHDIHLYEFSPKGLGSYPIIAHPDSLPEEEYTNSSKYKLNKYFETIGEKMIYTYDYGDCWEHRITLKEISKARLSGVIYLGGEGACPPEDCGGVAGYEDFKLAVNDPSHEDYKATREWVGLEEGELWDVNEADPDVIASHLQMYRV